MFVNGATQLSTIGLPPAWQYVAHACWLESAEEFIAAIEASWRKRVECGLQSAFDEELKKLYDFCSNLSRDALLLGERNDKQVAEHTPTLGEKLRGEQLSKLTGKSGCMRLRPFENIEPLDATIATPPAFELNRERWGDVYNQGHAPTCVAHAICDLVAWSRAPQGEQPLESLCPEFLHYLAHRGNGSQNSQSGSRLEYAMSVACEYGLCSREEFDNAINELNDLELACDALIPKSKSRRVLGQRPLPPSAIEEYKRILSGVDGVPLPIAVELVVFDSWLGSEMTLYAGKITLPLPGEPPCQSSHAVLITGYRDNVNVPGGGYFIVRNSWGENWGEFSPLGSGYAAVPYEYVARFAVSACTVATNVANDVRATDATMTDEEFERKFVVEFKESDVLPRDQDGNLCVPGMYIGSPDEPRSYYKPDSDENRKAFRERGYAWSQALRQKNFFPDACLAGDDFVLTETVRNLYLEPLNSNLSDLNGQDVCLDGITTEKVILCERVNDDKLNERFVSRACQVFGAPSDLSVREQWLERQRYLEYRLYKFTTTRRVFYVSVAFATGLTIQALRGPQRTEAVSSQLLGVMDEVFRSAIPSTDALHFKAFGAYGALELTDVIKSAADVLCCEYRDHAWIPLDTLEETSLAPAMVAFRKTLTPFARKDVVAIVRGIINTLYSELYSGNIRVKDVVRRCDLTDEEVSSAFDELNGNGFDVYYTQGYKEKAIRRV